MKKLPKTEDSYTFTTYYQRAHVKNVQRFFFSNRTKDDRKCCFAQSCDDKAYLRPGMSERFEKTRNIKILTLANEGAKQLPKYDWSERMTYQTPATHRILNKEGVDVNGQEKLHSTGDEHFVFIRPKQLVDSSGTTWGNETHGLRCHFPDSFEVNNMDGLPVIPQEIRCFTSSLQADVCLYFDMSEKDYVEKVTTSPSCEFREHEKRHLIQRIQNAELELAMNANQFETSIDEILGKICTCVTAITDENALLLYKLEVSTPVY